MVSVTDRKRGKAVERVLAVPGRLQALRETDLLDAQPVEALDRAVELIRLGTGASIALVSLVDNVRQFFTSASGLPSPLSEERQTPLSHSFCKHVVADASPLIVDDATKHPLVCDNPAVPELGIQAYAGIPIRTGDGHILGSVCAVDAVPREWTEDEIRVLELAAAMVEDHIALRRRAWRAEASEKELAAIHESLLADSLDQDSAVRAATHDLRSPLSVLMLGVAHLMSHDATRTYPELRKLLETMHRNAEHASSLIATMHDLSRLAAETNVVEPGGATDLHEIVRDTLRDFEQENGPRIEYRAAEDETLEVALDPTSVRRCIENLVGNGRRFAHEVVRITVRELVDEVEIVVEDDGDGLPTRSDYATVWKPNVRFHESSGLSGSGLGLSIVKETVERAGGSVRGLPSRLGGARFVITLPLAE